MSFNVPSIDTIYNRVKADMEARVSSGVKVSRFSILGILALVFAGACHLIYEYITFIADQLFPDTAITTYLDRIANIYGLPRKAATYSTGQVEFTGVDGTAIPEGTLLQDTAGIQFATLAEVTIAGGNATADVQADTAGTAGNTSDPTLSLVAPITDVDTDATITTEISGGQERETDEELRARVLQRIQAPPSSGTEADYIRWALEVEGVGKAWVFSGEDYLGAGTVAVLIATSDLDVVDPAVKANVAAYIETVRPIGANVDVQDIVPLDTDYLVQISPDTTALRDNVKTNLENLHLAEAAPGGTLLLSHIRNAIATSGVADYDIQEIDLDGDPQGVENIVTTGFDTAKFNSVSFD